MKELHYIGEDWNPLCGTDPWVEEGYGTWWLDEVTCPRCLESIEKEGE